MAFSSSVTKSFPLGPGLRLAFGTFTNAATDSGGSVDTGFQKKCDVFFANHSSHFNSGSVKITLSGTTATIVTDDGADGYWFALGL